jgi:small subunit ribosomal protein S6
MRIYEELFIVRPDVTDEEIDPLIDQLTGVISSHGGKVDKTDKWGVRKLAYRVEKRNEGYYVLIQFTAGPEIVKELERRLRVADLVMKFITVRIDEKLKKIEKRKKSREKRALRRPAPPVAAPSMPMGEPAAGPTPGGPMPGAPMPGAPAPAHPAPGHSAPAPAHAPVTHETAEKEQ